MGWSGLTTTNVAKYLDKTSATAKGHFDQNRKNIKSTKNVEDQTISDNISSPAEIKTNQLVANVISEITNLRINNDDNIHIFYERVVNIQEKVYFSTETIS